MGLPPPSYLPCSLPGAVFLKTRIENSGGALTFNATRSAETIVNMEREGEGCPPLPPPALPAEADNHGEPSELSGDDLYAQGLSDARALLSEGILDSAEFQRVSGIGCASARPRISRLEDDFKPAKEPARLLQLPMGSPRATSGLGACCCRALISPLLVTGEARAVDGLSSAYW